MAKAERLSPSHPDWLNLQSPMNELLKERSVPFDPKVRLALSLFCFVVAVVVIVVVNVDAFVVIVVVFVVVVVVVVDVGVGVVGVVGCWVLLVA